MQAPFAILYEVRDPRDINARHPCASLLFIASPRWKKKLPVPMSALDGYTTSWSTVLREWTSR